MINQNDISLRLKQANEDLDRRWKCFSGFNDKKAKGVIQITSDKDFKDRVSAFVKNINEEKENIFIKMLNEFEKKGLNTKDFYKAVRKPIDSMMVKRKWPSRIKNDILKDHFGSSVSDSERLLLWSAAYGNYGELAKSLDANYPYFGFPCGWEKRPDQNLLYVFYKKV